MGLACEVSPKRQLQSHSAARDVHRERVQNWCRAAAVKRTEVSKRARDDLWTEALSKLVVNMSPSSSQCLKESTASSTPAEPPQPRPEPQPCLCLSHAKPPPHLWQDLSFQICGRWDRHASQHQS